MYIVSIINDWVPFQLIVLWAIKDSETEQCFLLKSVLTLKYFLDEINSHCVRILKYFTSSCRFTMPIKIYTFHRTIETTREF